MKRVCLSTITLLLLATTSLADWPEFRGPRGNGEVTASGLPLEWTASQGMRWRTELPGEGWSSPVAVGDRVYLTAAIPTQAAEGKPNYDLALLIVDVGTGELIRRSVLFTESGASAPKIHEKNSHASPTPLVDGERIYVHFGHQGTACTDLNGKVLWRNDSLGYPPVHGNGGSPVVVGELLIFARDGSDISEVTALDKLTGKLVWQTGRDVQVDKRFSFCTPLILNVGGQTQVIVPGSNVVQSLEPTTGREIWRLTYEGYSVIPRPVFEAGLVFICTGYNRPSLLAIDPTGHGDVTQTHLRWSVSSSSIPHTPSLVAFDGKVAMVSDKGIAACYEAATGKELWQERLGGNFSASPILAGSRMYALSESGECIVLDVADQPQELARNMLGERTLASPAVVDQDLLVRTAQALYRIGR